MRRDGEEGRDLDDRVHGTGFLAQAAIDAFRHVDVVTRRATTAVGTRLGLDGDRLKSNRMQFEHHSLT